MEDTVLNGLMLVWLVIMSCGIIGFWAEWLFGTGTKVRYKDGQLQVKYRSGKWECYDTEEVQRRCNDMKGDICRIMETEAKINRKAIGRLNAMIHANHRPVWEYISNNGGYDIPIGVVQTPYLKQLTINLRCKKCGYDKKFEPRELPVAMRNALIKTGVLEAPQTK